MKKTGTSLDLQLLKGNMFLFLAALAWGTTFVVQRTAMDHMGPFLYSGLRFLLGAAFLLPIALYRGSRTSAWQRERSDKWLPVWGSCLTGVLICIGINLQQIGLVYTTAGNAGFITGLYVVFVPFLGVFFGYRIYLGVWIGAPLAAIGLYLLSVTSGLTLNQGDVWVLASAFVWAVQVLTLGLLAPKIDSVLLAFGQSFVCGALSLILAIFLDDINMAAVRAGWLEIAYGGIISVGIGFTLQVVGQKYSQPSHAAIILQLEAVIAALAGWIFLNEIMSNRAVSGAALMLLGMLIAQLLPPWKTLKPSLLPLPK
ncbi:MAG: DMT family transporter [Desulfobulbaceae bacterium]|nr:DMT family transporter [Desulfobulbaceae bacterium]